MAKRRTKVRPAKQKPVKRKESKPSKAPQSKKPKAKPVKAKATVRGKKIRASTRGKRIAENSAKRIKELEREIKKLRKEKTKKQTGISQFQKRAYRGWETRRAKARSERSKKSWKTRKEHQKKGERGFEPPHIEGMVQQQIGRAEEYITRVGIIARFAELSPKKFAKLPKSARDYFYGYYIPRSGTVGLQFSRLRQSKYAEAIWNRLDDLNADPTSAVFHDEAEDIADEWHVDITEVYTLWHSM